MYEPSNQAMLPLSNIGIRDSQNNDSFPNQTSTPVLTGGTSSQNKTNSNVSQDNNTVRNPILLTNSYLMDSVPTQPDHQPSKGLKDFQTTFKLDYSLQGSPAQFPLIPVLPTQTQDQPKQNETIVAIEKMVDSAGGVSQVNKVSDYIDLLKNETTFDTRSMLLTMMSSSRPIIQEAFIAKGGLTILDQCLEEGTKLTPLILKLLGRLPVDMQALKDNGNIGKTVKKLCSSQKDKKIKKQAKSLFRSWTKLVNRSFTAQETTSKKRKELPTKEEPPKKVPRLSAGFKTKQLNGSSELKIVKRTPPVPSTKDNQSNKVNPKPNTTKSDTKPNHKPLQRLFDPIDNGGSTRSLKVSSNSVNNSSPTKSQTKYITSTKSCKPLPPDATPMASCLKPDPTLAKEKKVRSVSWADDSLVTVKYFPRDKTLAFDNPNMRAIKARLAQQQQQQPPPNLPPSAPKPVPKPAPSMRPSLRWSTPARLKLSNISIPYGSNSTEVATQPERERTALKARYPNVRSIPPSPSNSKVVDTPLRDSEIPCIPLNDQVKQNIQQISQPISAVPTLPGQNYYPPTNQFNNGYGVSNPHYEAPVQLKSTGTDFANLLRNPELMNLLAQSNSMQMQQPRQPYQNGFQNAPYSQPPPSNQHYHYSNSQQPPRDPYYRYGGNRYN